MVKATVYSKEGCAQCNMLKRFFNDKGIEYEERRVDLVDEYLNEVKADGISSLPYVKAINGTAWTGIRMDMINALQNI